jgi:anti-sigma regulatory factor (Ser/Thr protein kinase)
MGYKYNSVRSTIESDRVSGFKNSSYAVAEVLDNSIQAGFRTKKSNCEIQLIIVEEKISIGLNNFDRISKIIVADNGDGLDVETLSKA